MKPIVQVGKGGIDEGLLGALEQALTDHELVKVKVGESAGLDRHEAAENLATATKSHVAQVLGNIVLLYRPDPEDPQIKLPKPKAAGADTLDEDEDDDGDDEEE